MEDVFYMDNRLEGFPLPLNKRRYVFHPIIIDAVNIKPVGKPVIPYAAGK